MGAQFGIPTYLSMAADYDGDDKADIAVFRSGVWYFLQQITAGFTDVLFGAVNRCARAECFRALKFRRQKMAEYTNYSAIFIYFFTARTNRPRCDLFDCRSNFART